jgi:hypothetical protein
LPVTGYSRRPGALKYLVRAVLAIVLKENFGCIEGWKRRETYPTVLAKELIKDLSIHPVTASGYLDSFES